mmetsp:Transcript_9898/g.16282  ORF Transcript_9898/g.16282 Transcript_9898/m.16282 type:complete len:93 (-) Transcript_9898:225-503(-)
MSKRGVWQLKRLTIFYCSRGGSSRGAREYIDTRLVDFAKSNPQLQIIAAIRNGRHPFVHGEYGRDPRKNHESARWLRPKRIEARNQHHNEAS